MQRTIEVALNAFEAVPPGLQMPELGGVVDTVTVDLANLYHHYYMDSYDCQPPDPDPAHFEYLRFLATSRDFRLLGDGIGSSVSKRRHASNELGQAFCRWFLHEFLDIVYFARIEDLMGRADPRTALQITRRERGDAPDYLCADSANSIPYLAEAKGRTSSISFNSRDFQSWRRQFEKILVLNSAGISCLLKGFVVATRFGTELQERVRSRIYVEDPLTLGREAMTPDEGIGLTSRIKAIHYSYLASKLDQPILAASLRHGFLLPDEIRVI